MFKETNLSSRAFALHAVQISLVKRNFSQKYYIKFLNIFDEALRSVIRESLFMKGYGAESFTIV